MGYFSSKMTPNVAYLLIFLFLAVDNSSAEDTYDFAGIPFQNPTLGPINVNISTAYDQSADLPPLRLVLVKSDLVQFNNTGNTITATLAQPFSSSTMTGGVLGPDTYEFEFMKFYWTQDLRKWGTDSINSEILVFIGSAYFRNRKYPTLSEALKERFGLAEFAMPFKICSTHNTRYDKFGEKVKEIRIAGTSTETTLGTLMEGLDLVGPEGKYYAYPGGVPNESSTSISFSVTVNLQVPNDEMCITKEQFESTVYSLRNSNGLPLDTSRDPVPYTLPVVAAQGVLQTWAP